MPNETHEGKMAYAMLVVERYFDTDIEDADSAMDVLLDNNVDPDVAAEIVRSMFGSYMTAAEYSYSLSCCNGSVYRD